MAEPTVRKQRARALRRGIIKGGVPVYAKPPRLRYADTSEESIGDRETVLICPVCQLIYRDRPGTEAFCDECDIECVRYAPVKES